MKGRECCGAIMCRVRKTELIKHGSGKKYGRLREKTPAGLAFL